MVFIFALSDHLSRQYAHQKLELWLELPCLILHLPYIFLRLLIEYTPVEMKSVNPNSRVTAKFFSHFSPIVGLLH